jgi:hypothetical protein
LKKRASLQQMEWAERLGRSQKRLRLGDWTWPLGTMLMEFMLLRVMAVALQRQ